MKVNGLKNTNSVHQEFGELCMAKLHMNSTLLHMNCLLPLLAHSNQPRHF